MEGLGIVLATTYVGLHPIQLVAPLRGRGATAGRGPNASDVMRLGSVVSHRACTAASAPRQVLVKERSSSRHFEPAVPAVQQVWPW